jgi:hypothetical protein
VGRPITTDTGSESDLDAELAGAAEKAATVPTGELPEAEGDREAALVVRD